MRACAQGVANYLTEKTLAQRGLIIGYDTRFASEGFASAAAEIVAGIYTDVGSWLHEQKGIGGQWDRELSLQSATDLIDTGELYLVCAGAALVGCVRVTDQPDHLWLDRPGRALYVHSMAVARPYSGRGIGRAILSWAADRAAKQDASLLRLDCMASNSRLGRYYEEAGFTPLGVHPTKLWFALFEKSIASHQPAPGS